MKWLLFTFVNIDLWRYVPGDFRASKWIRFLFFLRTLGCILVFCYMLVWIKFLQEWNEEKRNRKKCGAQPCDTACDVMSEKESMFVRRLLHCVFLVDRTDGWFGWGIRANRVIIASRCTSVQSCYLFSSESQQDRLCCCCSSMCL